VTVEDSNGKEKTYLRKDVAKNPPAVHITVDALTGPVVNQDKDGKPLLSPDNLPDKIVVHSPSLNQPSVSPFPVAAVWSTEWDFEWDGK